MSRQRILRLWPVAFPLVALLAAQDVAAQVAALRQEPVRYGRDVRPILADRCFLCHGPDAGKREAELRLDVREIAIADRDGYAAIVPGKPEASELLRRVASQDPEERMPPPDCNKPALRKGEIELLRRWIAEGATYEPHWAFQPPRRPPVPDVADARWARNDVDRFVQARLERARIAPGPPADRDTLLRRVFLDLTGLPPTPQERDAFLADQRPEAYERLVDKLLTEEPYRSRYAERMTAPWLDAARYADTIGIHTDAGRTIWPWRDWVLHAFRDNMPFDRFLGEQLAGDLMPDATLAQKVASGFNRCHVITDEGGAISDEYLVEYAVDRATTTASVFLGLTFTCARCHDHKFDPITQTDFYRLYAFFNSNDEPGLYSQLPDARRAFEPFLAVPSPEQEQEMGRLRADLVVAKTKLEAPSPGEGDQRARYLADLWRRAELRWPAVSVVEAKSTKGATLTAQADGSVLATGSNPATDEHRITLRTEATGLNLLRLDALEHEPGGKQRLGRGPNGNVVLTGVVGTAVSKADPSRSQALRFSWAWADHEQENGDFVALNVLDGTDKLGWAVEGHKRPGGRTLLLLADEPFGFEGGTDVQVRLQYLSVHGQHVFGRVRLLLGSLGAAGREALPAAASGWYVVGPFTDDGGQGHYQRAFGPETEPAIDLGKNFGFGNQYWRHDQDLDDGRVNRLPDGVHAIYVGRRVVAPTARRVELSLGSDDGLRVFVNGVEAFGRDVARGAAPDQDKVAIDLRAGANALVLKIVNTGGRGGVYHKSLPRKDELFGDLVAALVPAELQGQELGKRFVHAWRRSVSPEYRALTERVAALEGEIKKLEAAIPKTMVMQELAEPRPAWVLVRGQYDQPDKKRPVQRGLPAVFGELPAKAPRDRRGLAQWMTSAENPLVARVAVNRIWELLFGEGIVRTTEDFGLQGEWPSHPELLDWLAVEFRERGWDVQHLLRLLVTSATYRQSSRARPEAREVDPDNRLLAWFPRRRLSAEQLRDQALYAGGLLVERLGGPPVKPYHPQGLWEEVSMPQSNTRVYVQGKGDELWRRSLYTYWKRACPPPSLMTLDAPTREFCQVRRPSTNTPLQSLVLWNDPQFVEAARALAQRTLAEKLPEAEGLRAMFVRCTARLPEAGEESVLRAALGDFRARFARAKADANKLLAVGEAPRAAGEPAELAAWTMLGNTLLNLDATVCRN